jgi:HPt (histidine-containing phosphotransfer) domain-containing protein
MDCHMPVMDGFDATKAIRRRGDAKSAIPVIAMTAGAMTEDRQRCLAVGMDDYLAKPVNVQAVQEVLARWVTASPNLPTPASSNPSETIGAPVQPAIDQQRLADLSELGSPGDSSFLAALVGAFTRDSATSLTAIREAAGAEATNHFRLAAHELKGASANIGANRVAAVCSALEAGKHHITSDTTTHLLNQLEAELDLATHALADALAGQR